MTTRQVCTDNRLDCTRYYVRRMDWLPEPWAVVSDEGRIYYRDTDEGTVRGVCADLNRGAK